MSINGDVVSLDDYVLEQTAPYVASALRQMVTRFGGCRVWQDENSTGMHVADTVHAAPLPADAGSTFGYGKRTGASISVSSHIRAIDSRHSWEMWGDGYMPTRRGRRGEGIVELKSDMHMRFGVPRGTPDDGSEGGFLCWAEEYALPDGSSCLRLSTYIGDLWLQPANMRSKTAGVFDFELRDSGSRRYIGPRVVHLQRQHMGYRVTTGDIFTAGPRAGLSSVDRFGRRWTIEKDDLRFGASLELEVVGRYNDRLRLRPGRLECELPYRAALQINRPGDGAPDVYVPFAFGTNLANDRGVALVG